MTGAPAVAFPPLRFCWVIVDKPCLCCCRRYYIGCDKLAELGWVENTTWEEGLKTTIDWYMDTNVDSYWTADLDLALRPHPVVFNQSAISSGAASFLV
jgi:hypothetical protein